MALEKLTCYICNNIFYRYVYDYTKINMACCSRKCQGEKYKTTLCGKNNPNYGNRYSDETRKVISDKVKQHMQDPDIRYKVGSANRGKKFSKDRIAKMVINRTPESYSHPHSEKSKKIIGQKSKAKFTPEYNLKQRKQYEDLGYWIKLEDKSDWQIYSKLSNWIQRMFDLISDESQLTLLNKLGIFNAYKNKRGVVRDHIYCRLDGFNEGIFPEIMRHPCNCQIITHSDNVKKKSKRYIDKSNISKEELFERIKNYNKQWIEQQIVLDKILLYETGERWKNEYKHNKE